MIKNFNNFDLVSESLEDDRKKLMQELSNIGKKIKKLEREYQQKIDDIHKLEDKIDKSKSKKNER